MLQDEIARYKYIADTDITDMAECRSTSDIQDTFNVMRYNAGGFSRTCLHARRDFSGVLKKFKLTY